VVGDAEEKVWPPSVERMTSPLPPTAQPAARAGELQMIATTARTPRTAPVLIRSR